VAIPDKLPTREALERYSPEPNTGCWLWMGHVTSWGYGILSLRGKPVRAHRYFYQSLRGPISDGKQLDHLCRVKCCVNPNHLEVVTSRVNVLRGIGPSAVNIKKEYCLRGHSLSGDNLYVPRDLSRQCRECKRFRDRRRRMCKREALHD
jgi:HNH endonuclease